MSKETYEKLSIPDLIIKKKGINKMVYTVLFGLIIYASVLFYLMHNGNEQAGDFLFFVPVIGLILAIYAGRNLNLLNAELQKRLQ